MFHINVWGLQPEILLHIYILGTSSEQQDIWTSKRIFCFASCMGVNITQKYLNGINEEEICFHASLSSSL